MAGGAIRWRLGMDAADFNRGLDSANAQLTGFLRNLGGATGALGSVAAAMGPVGLVAAAGLGVATAGAVMFTNAVKEGAVEAVKYAGRITDLSTQTGLLSVSLQKLDVANSLVGGSTEATSAAIRKMQDNMESAPEKFAQLNLNVQKLKELAPEKQFEEVGRAILKVSNANERVAAGTDLMGKSYQEALKVLSLDLDATGEKAQRLGLIMGDDMRESLDGLGDSATLLSSTWEHLWMNLGGAVASTPELTGLVDDLTEGIGELSTFIVENQDLIQDLTVLAIEPLAAGVRLLTSELRDAVGGFNLLRNKIDEIKGAADEGFVGMLGALVSGNYSTGAHKPSTGNKLGSNAFGGELKYDPLAEAKKKAAEKAAREQAAADKKAGEEEVARALVIQKQLDGMYEQETQKIKEELDKQGALQQAANEKRLEERRQLLARWAEVDAMEMARPSRDELDSAALREIVSSIRDAADGMFALGDAVGGVGGAFLSMGATAFDVLATINDEATQSLSPLEKMGGVLSTIASIWSSTKDKTSAGGGLAGAMAGASAGAMFGPLGAGIGAVAGGVLGFLRGGKSAAEKRAEAKAAAEAEARQAVEDAAAARDYVSKAVARQVAAMGGITGGLGPGGRVTGGIQIVDEKSAAAQAQIFNSTFWKAIKENGLVAGIDALKGPFDALKVKLAEGGYDADKLLGSVSGYFAAFENEAVRPALEGMDALREALAGQNDAQMLTTETFAAFGVVAVDALKQAEAGGLSHNEALRASRPLLAEIIRAHNEYGYAIDAETQALIDQSIAADGAFPVDPVLQMRDAVRELINEIRIMNGLPARDWGSPPPGIPGGVGGGGGSSSGNPNLPEPGENPGGNPQTPEFKLGGVYTGPDMGLARLHHGEVVLTPEQARAVGGGAGAGGITFGDIHVHGAATDTPEEFGRRIVRAVRENLGNAGTDLKLAFGR